jgi:hypothetical protein
MAMILAMALSGNAEQRDGPHGAKALVMAVIARMVAENGARIVVLESGARELRLATGEVFRLGLTSIKRIA